MGSPADVVTVRSMAGDGHEAVGLRTGRPRPSR
jgi:hypothetical protein